MTTDTTTDAHILATFSKHEARAMLITPGGILFPDDLRGIYRTVAGIHGVTVDRVKQVVMEGGGHGGR